MRPGRQAERGRPVQTHQTAQPAVDPLLTSEAPFANQPKVEIPSEAAAINHFLRGQLLLGEGDFDGALKEYESAAQANPNESFLRFRLASLHLRKGENPYAKVAERP